MVESEQKKPGFFSKTRNVVLVIIGVLVVLFVIFAVVDNYRMKQDALQAEEEMALYIVNEAKLAEGEEIESITFDVVTEECDTWAVCGAYAHKTEIYIKSTQREWTIKAGSYPDEHWYLLGAYDICVGGETTDEELCFVHYAEDVYDSTWKKNLDGITVHYDTDFSLE